jgi:phage shock protein PspC (stress-responsive transcriptional regulator)
VSSIWTIRRSATDSKLTGLCGGVARYWGIDPTLVRVGVALLALSGGVGLVLYLAGWLLIPVEGKTTAAIDDLLGPPARNWSKEIWVGIVAVACIASFAIFGALTPFGVGPAILLAAIWYFGFYKDRKPGHPDVPPPPAVSDPEKPEYEFVTYSDPPTPFTEAAAAWRQRIEENTRQSSAQQSVSQDNPGEPGVAIWPAPPATNLEPPSSPAEDEMEQRQAFLAEPDPVGIYSSAQIAQAEPASRLQHVDTRSARRLRLVSLLVLGLTLGGLGVADYLGAVLPIAAYFGAALLVVGLGLIAAAWLGRARGLLPLGIVLLVGVLATSAISTAARYDDWARPMHSYTSAADLPPSGDSRDLGRLTTDLSKLSMTGDVTYRAHVDLGTLTVIVPPEAQVRVDYAVDSGAVDVFDTVVAAGNELHDVYMPESASPGTPILTLDLSADMGKVVVRR